MRGRRSASNRHAERLRKGDPEVTPLPNVRVHDIFATKLTAAPSISVGLARRLSQGGSWHRKLASPRAKA